MRTQSGHSTRSRLSDAIALDIDAARSSKIKSGVRPFDPPGRCRRQLLAVRGCLDIPSRARCAALPPKSTFVGASVMSAMGQKRIFRHSLDHLVSAGDERRRHGETEHPGGLEVENHIPNEKADRPIINRQTASACTEDCIESSLSPINRNEPFSVFIYVSERLSDFHNPLM